MRIRGEEAEKAGRLLAIRFHPFHLVLQEETHKIALVLIGDTVKIRSPVPLEILGKVVKVNVLLSAQ